MKGGLAVLLLATAAAASPPEALRQVKQRGPVKVTLTVRPARPRLSDTVTLTFQVESRAGVKVSPPSLALLVREFAVRDFAEGLPEVRGQKEVYTWRYRLEPLRTGTHLLPAVSLTFTTPDGKEHRLTTDPLEVKVVSLLKEKVPRLDRLAPLRGPLELPAGKPLPLWVLAGGGGAVVLALLLLWWRRRRRHREAPARSPAELAHEELQQLLARDLLTEGRYGDFYAELTAIVRRYIERTTGVRAPEMTTEEFLREMERRRLFGPPKDRELAAFLQAADLIKFAAQVPGPEEVERSFALAQTFVGLREKEAA